MLKNHEQNIRSILSEYLNIEIHECEVDPPDCYLNNENNMIFLEITSIHDIYYDFNEILPKATIIESISDYLDKLSDKYFNIIDSNHAFCFFINGPLRNYSFFKKSLDDFINILLKDYSKYPFNKSVTCTIGGEEIRFMITNRRTKSIFGLIGIKNNYSEYNLHDQARLCILSAIHKKDKIMNKFPEVKWLAIDCKQILSEYELFYDVLNQIDELACFSKIFLVHGDNVFEKSR